MLAARAAGVSSRLVLPSCLVSRPMRLLPYWPGKCAFHARRLPGAAGVDDGRSGGEGCYLRRTHLQFGGKWACRQRRSRVGQGADHEGGSSRELKPASDGAGVGVVSRRGAYFLLD